MVEGLSFLLAVDLTPGVFFPKFYIGWIGEIGGVAFYVHGAYSADEIIALFFKVDFHNGVHTF